MKPAEIRRLWFSTAAAPLNRGRPLFGVGPVDFTGPAAEPPAEAAVGREKPPRPSSSNHLGYN